MYSGKEIHSYSINRFRIYDIGREDCKPGHSSSRALTDRYLIHYVLSGRGTLHANGREYQLKEGNAFLIGSGFSYYEADKDNPWEYAWIIAAGSPVNSFLEEAGLSEEEPIYTAKYPDLAAGYVNELLSIDGKNNYMIYAGVLTLFSRLLEIGSRTAKIKTNGAAEYVNSACDFIAANYHRNISSEDVCRHVGLEYSYLFRLFKRACGVSPAEYLTDYRMQQAAALCRRGMRVNEIALSVGYEDRCTFSKAFTRYFGISVSRYREMCGDGSADGVKITK